VAQWICVLCITSNSCINNNSSNSSSTNTINNIIISNTNRINSNSRSSLPHLLPVVTFQPILEITTELLQQHCRFRRNLSSCEGPRLMLPETSRITTPRVITNILLPLSTSSNTNQINFSFNNSRSSNIIINLSRINSYLVHTTRKRCT
jgi:hypothetical protein